MTSRTGVNKWPKKRDILYGRPPRNLKTLASDLALEISGSKTKHKAEESLRLLSKLPLWLFSTCSTPVNVQVSLLV